MKELVNENIRNLIPYQVADLDYDVKLDANENPYHIPEILDGELKKELKEEIFKEFWNYYPDADATELREALAQKCGVAKENIIMGNGSDEIILNLMLTYLNGEKAVVIHPPTFSIYKIFAQVTNGKVKEVPLTEEFELDAEKMEAAAKESDSAITIITYPNNPTGNLFQEEAVEKIIKNAKGIVVIDEAYYEFAGKTFMDRIGKYKNLVILRTLSKAYGIAGLRVGYMVADVALVNEVNKVRLPYNLNKISQLVALKMVKNDDKFRPIIKEILEERDKMAVEVAKIEGLKMYKSDTNSIFFRTEKAEEIFAKMLENRILVRKFSGNMKDFIRISIGKKEDNMKVVEILKAVMQKQ